MKKDNNQYLRSGGKTFTPCAARTIIFQKENLNYFIVCSTRCTLFFQYVWFLLPISLPCVICGNYVTRINAVSWHIARQTFYSSRFACLLGLFMFVHIACLLQLSIKTEWLCAFIAIINTFRSLFKASDTFDDFQVWIKMANGHRNCQHQDFSCLLGYVLRTFK